MEDYNEEEAERIEAHVANLKRIEELGESADDYRMDEVAQFRRDLERIVELGEEASEDRMREVGEFVENLEQLADAE